MDQSINELLPFMLRRENVARFEDRAVIIGDRRKYPFEKAFVRCPDVEAVARAIEDMVTQGGGPSTAAWYAMVLAAQQAESKHSEERISYLKLAQARLVNTRPTNPALARRLEMAMEVLEQSMKEGKPLAETLLAGGSKRNLIRLMRIMQLQRVLELV